MLILIELAEGVVGPQANVREPTDGRSSEPRVQTEDSSNKGIRLEVRYPEGEAYF